MQNAKTMLKLILPVNTKCQNPIETDSSYNTESCQDPTETDSYCNTKCQDPIETDSS